MKSAWAIARTLIKEVFRMKALMVFIAILTVSYTVIFALWLNDGTGRADQKVQTFISYSLRCTFALMSLLTIFISTATIARDIKRKEIFTIATKSISRGQYLLGKLLGMALFNFILLATTAGLIYGLTRVLAHTQPNSDDERNRINELILIARQSVKPQLDDVTDEARTRVEQIIAQKISDQPHFYKSNPTLINEMRASLTGEIEKQLILSQTSAPPGGHIPFHFTGLEPIDRENGFVYIRFKPDVSRNPEDLTIYTEWIFGPRDPILFGGHVVQSKVLIRTVHEFPIPASAVSDDGELYLVFRNPTLNQYVSIIFPTDSGIEALYHVGSFEANFLRSMFLIYLRLMFLAVLGMALGAWLSFPVAVLVVLVLYVIGISSNFIGDAMQWEAPELYGQIINFIMSILPSFAAYDPIPLIEKGRAVPLNILEDLFVALQYFIDNQPIPDSIQQTVLLFKDILVMTFVAFFGYLIFRFRELARVIV